MKQHLRFHVGFKALRLVVAQGFAVYPIRISVFGFGVIEVVELKTLTRIGLSVVGASDR